MVLSMRAILILVVTAGCGESLFDANGSGDGGTGDGGPDGSVPSTCPATCIADAAADFDGQAGGAGNRWRYLDDRRNRTWVAMTPSADAMVGADPNNTITTCAAQPTSPACASLPGALLVSTAGATSAADPALEVTTTTNEVVQVTLRVHVPTGSPEHVIRMYRNSREDVLFTATAGPGVTFDRAITVDALAGDRFLVAFAPQTMGARDIGVQLFVNGTGAVFPSKCQLAMTFAAASGNNIDNLCGGDLAYNDYNAAEIPPVLGAGPFPEQGQAADITPDRYYVGTELLERNDDTTVQLWVKHDMLVDPYGAWVFSDEDLNAGGGLGMVIYDATGPVRSLEVSTCTNPGSPLTFASEAVAYPNDAMWHFIRVTHTAGMVNICIDGKKLGMFAAPAGSLVSTFEPRIGRNVIWTPSGAFLDGSVDDVRVFTGALPCD